MKKECAQKNPQILLKLGKEISNLKFRDEKLIQSNRCSQRYLLMFDIHCWNLIQSKTLIFVDNAVK